MRPRFDGDGPVVGKEYNFNLVIDRHELQGMLGAEMVVMKEDPEKHTLSPINTAQFELMKEEGSKLFFKLTTTPSEAGISCKQGVASPYGLRLCTLDSVIIGNK